MAVSPTAGTRVEPNDGYRFLKGTTATFKSIFFSEEAPVVADIATFPTASIIQPKFLSNGSPSAPFVITTITGSLVAGQQYEYEFHWDIPAETYPSDEYIISYNMTLGGIEYNFGDEFFTITATPGQLSIKPSYYATVDDIRQTKFNIDSYLPEVYSKDLNKRNSLIEYHLKNSTQKLREELNLFKSRSMSENYRLFTVYHTIYTIMLASRGEDNSSVSDTNLAYWRREWEAILAQEKRESIGVGVPYGRG